MQSDDEHMTPQPLDYASSNGSGASWGSIVTSALFGCFSAIFICIASFFVVGAVVTVVLGLSDNDSVNSIFCGGTIFLMFLVTAGGLWRSVRRDGDRERPFWITFTAVALLGMIYFAACSYQSWQSGWREPNF